MNKLVFLAAAAALSFTGCRQAPEPLTKDDYTEKQWEEIQASGAAMLFWPIEEKRDKFARMEDFFNGDEVPPSAAPRPLAKGAPIDAAKADEVMRDADLAGLMVLKDGTVRYENYRHGFAPDKRWTSFSVAKMFVGVLTGAAVKDGLLKISQPVTDFVPELADVPAYDGVTIEHLLTMSSGVYWDEDQEGPENDIIQLYTRASAKGQDGKDPTVDFLRTRVRADAPGTKYEYKNGDTALLGVVVERAIGRSLADYAADKITQPAGFEAPMFWMTDQADHNIGPCCLSLRMADYARFGLWISEGLPDGKGGSVWTDDYRKKALSARMSSGEGIGYGYQMQITPRTIWHGGIFGQSVVATKTDNVVVITLAAWEKPDGEESYWTAISEWWSKMLEERV